MLRINCEAREVQAGDEVTLRVGQASQLGWLRVGHIKPHHTTRNMAGALLWGVTRVATGEHFDLVIHEGEMVHANRKERTA